MIILNKPLFSYSFFLFYFWLHWVFVTVWAFSSCGERGLLFVAVRRLLIAVASLRCGAWALGVRASVVVAHGLSSCGSRALERTGLVAPQHVGSSWTRAQTHVPCIGRQILTHCATREAQASF